MESIVHNFGSYLEDSVKSDLPKDAGKLIKHVKRYLDDNVEDNTLNFAIAKIFDDPYNFLKFLINIKDRANQKGWREVLSESIELLNHFLNNFYNKLRPYTSEIIKTCRTISTSNANANEKSKAINILCQILKQDSNIPIDDVTNIYESYFKFCSVHQKTTSAKVQRSVFVLLGIISNKYPYIIKDQNNLVDTYVLQLKRQSECSEKDRDNTVVSGCMDGLSNILETFPVTSEESKTKVYGIISKLLLSGSTRFDIRDVVKFISRHCSMFIEDIYKDVPELWFETIKKWALSKGENQKAGYIALEKYYEELANLLKTKTDQRAKNCFQFFFDYFLRTMKDEKADIIEVRLAIRGFGFFSVPCDQNLSEMFMIIVNRIEQDYFVQENPSIEQLEYLPDYIHCFSAILFQIGDYTFDQIDSLQQISVLMIKTFPKLSPIYHFSVFDSMILSMCYLYQNNPKYLENYLQRVVYQGVLWTCSHRTCFDVETIEDDNKTITYKNYLPLWKSLLAFFESNNSKYKDIHIDVKYSVVKMIYDELIKTLLLLINKLNLNTMSKDDTPITDPQISCQAEKIDDFVIFINVVDFYVDLFSTVNNNYFKNWIQVYTNQIMLKSSKYVFVSGFYKLLKLALQISDKLNYFDGSQLAQKEDRKILFKKILSHLEKTLLNVHEFKDDLQLSCLQLLLTLPLSFVSPLLPTFTPVFEISLNVGRGFLKLAETAVDSLEKWYKHFPKDDLKPLLREVLPYLDPFLRSKGFVGDPDVKLSLLEAKKSKRSKKRKVLIEQDSELANLQNKILMFIGQLDPEMCLWLIKTEVEIDQVTWDKQPYLKFTLPYSEVKPNIYLDRIIPRILELSLSSGDQKTRITACELLHSIVIFMLGTSRQMSMNEVNQMSKLFEKIMLPIIQLGCDSNDVVRQLFNPLVFQMVHWYSSPLQLMSKETSVLIDILMEGISHPNNTSVRDLSGKCIKEFVIWTIKQSRKEDLEKNSQNIHIIVNKLCSFSLHPNSFKRLGSALAFNHLYTHLREEISMVDIYWIELMYSLMISLSLEDHRSKNNSQLDAALNHIERVLREKNNIFNKHSISRRVPPEIEGPLLKDSTMWILKQTASNKTIYRRKAIQLFCSLATYAENCGSVKNFIDKFVNNDHWYFDYYENDLQISLDFWDKLGTPEIIFQYFQCLLKSLDAYKYLFDYNIPNIQTYFEKTKLLKCINYFLEHISTKKLEQCIKLFKQYDTDHICLPDETEQFLILKSQIIVAIFDYLSSVLDKSTVWCETLCQKYFWTFICHCVFEPTILGLTDEVLSKKLSEVFDKFCKKLPENYLKDLVENLTQYFKENYNQTVDFNSGHISISQRNILKGWLLIQNSKLKRLLDDSSEYFDGSIQSIFNSLAKEADKKTGVKLQSSVAEFADLHLQLCCKLTNCADILCDCLMNNEEIKHPDRFSNVFYGEYFLNCFEETIMSYIVSEHKCIKNLCRKWSNFDNNTSMIVVINILKYLSENPQIKKTINMNDLFETIIYGVYHLFKSSNLNLKDRNFQIELLSHINRLDGKQSQEIGLKFEFIKKWFLEQLAYYPENEIPKTILQFHTNLLCFLHCFTGPNNDQDNELESSLDAFLNKILNTPKDKLDNSDLLVLFKKLLDYLIISKSKIVLKPCIDTLAALKDEENVNIPKAIDQYLSSISADDQYKSINKVYLYCRTLQPENKYKISKTFLLPMLRFCHYNAFEEFYIQNIKNITDNLKSPLTNESTPEDIVNKSMNLILIDALFTRIKVSNFVDKSCPITKTLFPDFKKGNELLKESMKLVNQISKENLAFQDGRKELYRWYHCDALNSLVSIVCNSKNPEIDEKWFRMLFFIVKEDKNIWKNIIDIEEKIVVPQDFDKLPSRKKIFINIRNEHQQKYNHQIHYIESQSLFNSTLSEDICKFDFTNTLVRSQDFEQKQNTSDNIGIGSVYLKSIDYNNHECMATVMSLINHMVDNKITVVPDSNNTNVDFNNINLPLWLDDIKKLLIDSNVEQNVRIFISRVVHNTQHVFKYFAKHFFEAIVKFITDKCTGSGINYFVADLVLMLISWLETTPLAEISSPASELLNFLMSNASNDRQDMLKYNLEIIKTSVQIWKTIIEVPHEIILNKLQSQEKLVGIHLAGIILANDLIPWAGDKINEFIKSVCEVLSKERLKKFTKPCAELLGMILKYLDGKDELKKHFDLLTKQLDDILRQANTDKLFHSLEQIQIHYPVIIDKHLRKLSMLVFNETDTTLKCICLKNILRRIDNNDAKRFTYKDVVDLLNMDDNDVRLLTLQIANKMWIDFKKQHQILVISAVIEHKNDSNSTIRFAVYEVLISVYNAYLDENDNESVELIKLCKSVLLAALIDSDYEIQEKIENFWYGRYQSLKLTEKYEKFLVDIYSPDTENFYLGCVNFFLLHSCKDTPEYKKLMFEHPLSDCKFDEYQVLFNWRLQNASLAPLFSNSFSHFSAPQLQGVRETNSIKIFTPTQSSINLSLATTSSFLFDSTPQTVQNKTKEKEEIKTYGRMFLNEKSRSLGYAKQATERNIKTEQQRKERVKRKEGDVKMYRQYRKGDLPDVQIPYSALIDPLKILARRDATLSRQLYVMLFSGLVDELASSEKFIQNFNEGILSIFSQSYMYVPNVIGAFLDASFENNKKKNVQKIYVNSDTLSNVCKNSGLLPIGCLLMEEYISQGDDSPSSSKKGCGSDDDEVKQWVKLADMYKELNEWDAVIGIFSSSKMNCSSDISLAIHSEASSNWKEALNQYENLLNVDTDSNRKDFYYESFFKCFANLSDWQNMSKTICQLSEPTFWDADWNQDKLLPWYMMAEVNLSLEGGDNTIINNLSTWMKDKEKSEYMKDKFCEELAILSLLQNDLSASKHYAKNCFGKFLDDWSHLNPLFTKIRSKNMLSFQKLVDLNKYLHNKSANDLIIYWQNSSASSYSLPSSETRSLYRQLFISSLEQSSMSENSEENSLELRDIKLSCALDLVNNAIENNNYIVGRKYCKESKKYISGGNKLGNFKLMLAMSKVGGILAENHEGENKLNTLTDSWFRLDALSKKYVNTYPDLQIESSTQIFKLTQNIRTYFISSTDSYPEVTTKIQNQIRTKADFLPDLQNYGVNKLRNAILLGENILKESENVKVLNNLTEAYLSLVVFAQNQDDSEYRTDIVKYVLRAMKLGNKEARQIFPCLLQIPELSYELLETFKEESSSVPTWMFLLWIPQLLISLGSSTTAVEDIIERIAITYPQSLIYTYRLAREKYNLESVHLRNIIEKLDNLLSNPLADKFLSEMSYVCFPELYFNYHLETIIKTVSDCNEIKRKINKLSEDLKHRILQRPNFKSIETPIKNLELKEVTDLQEVKKLLHKIHNDNKQNLSTCLNYKLNQFSPWLANFKSSDHNTELEIPGQYLGESKPLTKYHAKICSFNQKITCMESLRKPFHITIFGNDSKEYSFLVKFGEDLRQDQRIQQLFTLTNNILKSDKNCQERNLFLEQYQVVPLTKSLGLIKVYENTKSLSQFLVHTVKDAKIVKKYKSVKSEYFEWIRAVAQGANVSDAEYYAKAALTYDKNEVNMMFNRFVNEIPTDILSKSFWSITMSPSTYTYLRHQFITSYSVMCVVHWLLGIGDRNQGNSLICLRTGRIVGIDFGYAFGATTQHSLIPELIPFRLTPHILAIMEPLKEIGIVEGSMVHVLKALRKKKHLLLSTMDVFLQDPTLDWLESTKTIDSTQSEDLLWHPNFKMDIVTRKLNGANSAAITIRELRAGVINIPNVKERYVSIVQGCESDVRSKFNMDGLTEEEQVKCLLDQATDYNILGRQYAGLELWM